MRVKNWILYSLAVLVILTGVLIKTGLISVGISPYSHYRLNENEARLIDTAISRFRERVKKGKIDEITGEIIANHRDQSVQNVVISEIREVEKKFGEPRGYEFFRAMVPADASKYYQGVVGQDYKISYFTQAEKGEFSEHFVWVIGENNEATLLNYSADEMQEWEIKMREFERYVEENYSHEVRIPFGDRFIEIRY